MRLSSLLQKAIPVLWPTGKFHLWWNKCSSKLLLPKPGLTQCKSLMKWEWGYRAEISWAVHSSSASSLDSSRVKPVSLPSVFDCIHHQRSLAFLASFKRSNLRPEVFAWLFGLQLPSGHPQKSH